MSVNRIVRKLAIRNSDLSYNSYQLVARSMEILYRVEWKLSNKQLGISINHVIRTALYGGQDRIDYKLCLLNTRVHIRVDKGLKQKLN